MRQGRPTPSAVLIRVAVAIGVAAALVIYCYAAFFRFPGQTYPFILGAVAIVAWRLGGITAGATLAMTALGVDIWVLEGEGLAIAKPEQAAGLSVLLCVGAGLIWGIRHIGRERDQLRNRLHEVETGIASRQGLLDEMVHRIRNDLAAMASLAALYGRPGSDPRSGIKALSERIGVLGRLYQRLHVSDRERASVEMSVFLHEIVEDLRTTHLGMRPISLEASIVSVNLPVQTASVIGLILNEAVSNALKYAFPDDQDGTITAILERMQEGEMRLIVCDDGVGPDGDKPKGTGMGTRLMKAMSAQIRGQYSFSRESGQTSVRVTFPG